MIHLLLLLDIYHGCCSAKQYFLFFWFLIHNGGKVFNQLKLSAYIFCHFLRLPPCPSYIIHLSLMVFSIIFRHPSISFVLWIPGKGFYNEYWAGHNKRIRRWFWYVANKLAKGAFRIHTIWLLLDRTSTDTYLHALSVVNSSS